MLASGTRIGRIYPNDKEALATLRTTRIEVVAEYALRILVGADLAFSDFMKASTSLQRLLPTATVEPKIDGKLQVLQVGFSGGEFDNGVTHDVVTKLVEVLEPQYLGFASGTLVFLSDPDCERAQRTIGVLLRLDVNGIPQSTDAQTLMNTPAVREALDLLQKAVAEHLKLEPGELIAVEERTGFLPVLRSPRAAA
jgi:hypothetical protein